MLGHLRASECYPLKWDCFEQAENNLFRSETTKPISRVQCLICGITYMKGTEVKFITSFVEKKNFVGKTKRFWQITARENPNRAG